MPRIRRDPWMPVPIRFTHLIADLADELRRDRSFGQPRIEEEEFPRTGNLRVTVLWNQWENVPPEERINIVLQAYGSVESKDLCNRIVLVDGFTFEEAADLGLLPYSVSCALRPSDVVTREQCREAMTAEETAILRETEFPQLRFATKKEALECCERLTQRLPGSSAVWLISMPPSSSMSTTTTPAPYFPSTAVPH